MTRRYVIQHFTICDGWIVFGTDEDGVPESYATRKEAQQELDAFLDDCRHTALDYGRHDFRIKTINRKARRTQP